MTPTLPTSTESPSGALGCVLPGFPIPRGFIPTTVYSLAALAVPLLFFFASFDYGSDEVVGAVIAVSAVGGLIVVFANDCCCWYNMMLFFHIGVEAKVIDLALTHSNAADVSERNQTLSMVSAIVIIAHLIPFLVSDRTMLLVFLAYVGVIVNTSTIVYLAPEHLLLVAASSLALLATTMIIGGICEIRTSLASLAMDAMNNKMCLTCDKFEL
jgi:hypothetical protein